MAGLFFIGAFAGNRDFLLQKATRHSSAPAAIGISLMKWPHPIAAGIPRSVATPPSRHRCGLWPCVMSVSIFLISETSRPIRKTFQIANAAAK
jgi:hypothetical protein